MEIKRNIHLNRIISTIAILLCICWMPVCAQIRIVDEQDGKPVAGAYIFSSDNHLLCISDSKGNIEPQSGMITISNVAYESKTIDASTIKGDVLLKQKVYALPEVTANKTDYIKLTGVFRDICRNNGKTILYREGIMPAIRAKRTQKAHQLQYFHPQRSQIVRHVTHQICEARYHKQHKGGHNIL